MWCMVSEQRRARSAQPQQRGAQQRARARGRTAAAPPRAARRAGLRLARPRRAGRRGRPPAAARAPAGRSTWTRLAVRRRRRWCAAPRGGGRSRSRLAASAVDVERALEAQRGRHVVGGAARLELVEEPEPLLGEGERQRPGRAAPGTSGGAGALRAGPPGRLDRARRARPRVGASNSARSGSSTPKASRTRETTRVASSEWPPSSKKLVVDARPARRRSSSAQIAGQHLLDRRARRDVGRPPRRRGSARAPAAPGGRPCRSA